MSGDEMDCTMPEMSETDRQLSNDILPAKSRERYVTVYKKFIEWRNKRNVKYFSEDILLSYFQELSQNMKPSSLWATYSMLRSTISINDNIDISTNLKLMALLKKNSSGYKSAKSKNFTVEQIQNFLINAPDEKYLFMKVILIFGISGACRKQEMRNINPDHVEDTGKSLIIQIFDSVLNRHNRFFVVPEEFYPKCKKYMQLRPEGVDDLPFFLNYANGRCTKQCVGINKIGSVPRQVAEFLGLPEAKMYTGHCFRRSSATILVGACGDLVSSRSLARWRSAAVAERCHEGNTNTNVVGPVHSKYSVNNECIVEPTSSQLMFQNEYDDKLDCSNIKIEKVFLEEGVDTNEYYVNPDYSNFKVENIDLAEAIDTNENVVESAYSQLAAENECSVVEPAYPQLSVESDYSDTNVEKSSVEETNDSDVCVVEPEYSKLSVAKPKKKKRYIFPGDFKMSDKKDLQKATCMCRIVHRHLLKQANTIRILRRKNKILLNKLKNIQGLPTEADKHKIRQKCI